MGRKSGENQSPSGSLGSPPTQAGSSQFQAKASDLAHKSRKKIKLSEPRNSWDGRLRARTKAAKASCQTCRTDRHKSVHKSSTKIKLSEPRNIWDGCLRPSTKNTKAFCQTSRISRPWFTWVLWSLDFGVGVFHEFFAYKFGGNELMQGRALAPQQVNKTSEKCRRTLTSQQVNWADEFRLEFVIADADLVAWGVCVDRQGLVRDLVRGESTIIWWLIDWSKFYAADVV